MEIVIVVVVVVLCVAVSWGSACVGGWINTHKRKATRSCVRRTSTRNGRWTVVAPPAMDSSAETGIAG